MSEFFKYADPGISSPESILGNNIEGTIHKEFEPTPDRILIPGDADIITISGGHENWKSTAAKIIAGVDTYPLNYELQSRLTVPGFDLSPVGQYVRNRIERETGRPFEEVYQLSDDLDEIVDKEQIRVMREARFPHPIVDELADGNVNIRYVTDNPVLLEGRYSGFLGAVINQEFKGKRQKYAPNIIRVLFHCSDEEELGERLANSERWSRLGLPHDETVKVAMKREKEMVEKANRLFPGILGDKDMHDPNLTIFHGELGEEIQVYNLIIDTAKKNPHLVTVEFFNGLLSLGGIKEVKRKNFANTPTGTAAFWALSALPRCQGLLDENQCNRYGDRTVDVYKSDRLDDMLAACSADHALSVRERKSREQKEIDARFKLRFGKNGFLSEE